MAISEVKKKILTSLKDDWDWSMVLEAVPGRAEQAALLWAAAGKAPTDEIERVIETASGYLDTATPVALLELIRKAYRGSPYHPIVEGWSEAAEPLFEWLAEHHPEHLTADDNKLTKKARLQGEYALIRAGKLAEGSAALLKTLTESLVGANEEGAAYFGAYDKVAPLDRRVAAIKKVVRSETRFYGWSTLAPHFEGCSDEDLAFFISRLSGGGERTVAVEVLVPLGKRLLPVLEAFAKRRGQERRGWAQLGLAGMLICQAEGEAVSKGIAALFAEDLQSFTDEGIEHTRRALEGMAPTELDATLAPHFEYPRQWLLMHLSADDALAEKALARAETFSVDDYKAKMLVRGLAAMGTRALPAVHAALEGKLKGPKPAIALRALGAIRDPSSLPRLLEFAGHATKALSSAAVTSLGEYGADAIPALAEGLCAKKKGTRVACAALLLKLPTSETRTAAIKAVIDKIKDTKIKERVASIIASGGGGEGAPEPTRHLYREALAEAKARPDWEQLLELAREDPEKVAKREALGNARWVAVVEAFRTWNLSSFTRALSTRTEFAAWAVVALLQKFPRKARIWEIKPVIQALQAQGALAVHPAKLALMSDPGHHPQHLLGALARHDAEGSVAIFIQYLPHSSKVVREVCVEALSRAPAGALGGVVELLTDRKKGGRLGAAQVCKANPIPGSEAALKKALEKEKADDVAAALEVALKALGAVPMVPGAAPAEEEPVAALGLDVEAVLQKEREARLPKFLDLEGLGLLRLKDGTPLSEAARLGFVRRLMKEGPDGTDDTTHALRAQLLDEDVHRWCLAIKDQWSTAGRKPNHKWAIYQHAVTAGPERFATVGPQIDSVASAGHHALAGWYLDVFARHESLVGASWIYHWVQNAETRAVKAKSRDALKAAAERRGLTVEALIPEVDLFIEEETLDKEIPNLQPISVNYGARSFDVFVGADGAARVKDQAGKIRKSLPKPKTGEDIVEVTKAERAFKNYKIKVKGVLKAQLPRVERWMVLGRTWGFGRFKAGLLAHPVLGPLFASVVFRGPEETLFTLTPDGAVGLEDEPVALSEDARVAIAHPIELEDVALTAWQAKLPKQPILQLHRPISRLAPQKASLKITAEDWSAGPFAKNLRAFGYRNAAPEDAGMVYEATRNFGSHGVVARIHHNGYPIGGYRWEEPLRVTSVSFETREGRVVAVGKVPKVVLSEVAWDLKRLRVTIT